MIADDGFYFGLGAFETVALENGTPIFMREHLQRLTDALRFLNISCPAEEISGEIDRFLSESPVCSGRMALKIAVSPRNILCSIRKNPYEKQDYLQGFRTDFSSVRRNETSPLTYHKTLNYGDCILEKRAARSRSIQEPIFLNTRGELAEGAATNIFFLQDGQVIAPPLSAGMLPGIARAYIYDRYSVLEQPIFPGDIADFQEMFLTNSLLGVMPVQRLGGHRFSSMKTGLSMARRFWEHALQQGQLRPFPGCKLPRRYPGD